MSWRTVWNISAKASAVPSLSSSASARSASSMILASLVLSWPGRSELLSHRPLPLVVLVHAGVLHAPCPASGAVLDVDLHGQHAGAAGLQALQDAVDLLLAVLVDDLFQLLDGLLDVVGAPCRPAAGRPACRPRRACPWSPRCPWRRPRSSCGRSGRSASAAAAAAGAESRRRRTRDRPCPGSAGPGWAGRRTGCPCSRWACRRAVMPDFGSPALASPLPSPLPFCRCRSWLSLGLPSPGLPSLGLPSPGLASPGLPSPALPSPGLPSFAVARLARLAVARLARLARTRLRRPSGPVPGGFASLPLPSPGLASPWPSPGLGFARLAVARLAAFLRLGPAWRRPTWDCRRRPCCPLCLRPACRSGLEPLLASPSLPSPALLFLRLSPPLPSFALARLASRRPCR